MKKILPAFGLITMFFSSASHAYAAETEFGPAANLGEFVTKILAWAVPVIGSLAVIMIIVAGYMYMTSQGNPEPIKKAKEIIIGVIAGLALLFLATLLFNTIGVGVVTP
jgi:type IV secretory pathway VirB2 component (pilin)